MKTDLRIESRATPPKDGKPAHFYCEIRGTLEDGRRDQVIWQGDSEDADFVRGMAERAMADLRAHGHLKRLC